MQPDTKKNASSPTQADPGKERIGIGEKVGYGIAGGANNVIWTGISTFLVYFYTDVAGVAAGIVGTILLFSRVFDGVSDVAMGVMVDKTTSRHGKARPWLLWLAVPFAVVAVLLFTVPNAGDLTTIVYIVLTYNLALLIYTAIEIPHGTLGALITYDQHQRSVLNIAKMTGAYIAIIAISNVTTPFVDLLGGGQAGWVYTFIVYGAIAATIYFVTFRTTRERTVPGGIGNADRTPPVLASVKALVRNKYWVIVTLVLLLMYVYNAVTSGMAIYYSEYVLGAPAFVGALITALTLATLVGVLLVAPIAKRLGKRNTAIVGCVAAVVGSLVIMVDPANTTVAVVGQVIRGLGKACVMGLVFAMLADTMEYGEWKTGTRIEGLIYSGASMGIKIGTGLGSALIGWGLALSGYAGGQAVQSQDATSMIIALFVAVPSVVSVLMIALLCFYGLDKEYPRILRELKEAKAA